jgi:hypothetical protein
MSALLPFDKKPPARVSYEKCPTGTFLYLPALSEVFKVKGKVASGGLRDFLKEVP